MKTNETSFLIHVQYANRFDWLFLFIFFTFKRFLEEIIDSFRGFLKIISLNLQLQQIPNINVVLATRIQTFFKNQFWYLLI